jgi:hypothetical protein
LCFLVCSAITAKSSHGFGYRKNHIIFFI